MLGEPFLSSPLLRSLLNGNGHEIEIDRKLLLRTGNIRFENIIMYKHTSELYVYSYIKIHAVCYVITYK